MTLVDALKKNKPLRRPISKHMGSSGDGYLGVEYVFNLLVCGQIRTMWVDLDSWISRPILIDKVDILADDWEVKE